MARRTILLATCPRRPYLSVGGPSRDDPPTGFWGLPAGQFDPDPPPQNPELDFDAVKHLPLLLGIQGRSAVDKVMVSYFLTIC